MKSLAAKILLVFLLLSLAGLAALGYGYFKLRQERNALDEARQDLERKVALLEKKYAEKRALESQLTRAKLSLEGRLRAMQSEMEEIEKEKAALMETGQDLDAELGKARARVATLEKSLKELSEQHKGLQTELVEARKKYENTVKDHQNELAKLSAEKKEMELDLNNSLKAANQKIERFEAHNARLLLIAKDLVEAYKQKGVSTSILQAEPFTQIQKVEIEQFEQEYMDRIEREKIRKERSGG